MFDVLVSKSGSDHVGIRIKMLKRINVIALLGLMFLTNCGSNQQEVQRQEYNIISSHFVDLRASCIAQYPDEPPTMSALQKCKNDAYEQTMVQFDSHQDLSHLLESGDIEIADEADKGQITVDQAHFKKAQLNEQVTEIINERNAQSQQEAAERLTAISNYLSATRPLQPVPPPQPFVTPLFPPTVTTNCNSFGNQTSCTSR